MAGVRRFIAKRPAVAWLSGGSASRPTKGTPLKRPAASFSPTYGKHGKQRLARRVEKGSTAMPVGRRVNAPYTPTDALSKYVGGERNVLRTAADKSALQLETIFAMSEVQLKAMLFKGGYVQNYTRNLKQRRCVTCKEGKYMEDGAGGDLPRYRCMSRTCRQRLPMSKQAPAFTVASKKSLRQQTAMLYCAVWDIPQALVPAIVKDVSHNSVELAYKSWRCCLQRYVEHEQTGIRFGGFDPDFAELGQDAIDEFEVDEGVIRAKSLPENLVEWNEYVGMKRRGDRTSYFLQQRSVDDVVTARCLENGRAAPPPMTTNEWTAIKDKRVGPRSLCHSDGARAYKRPATGGFVDSVRHGGTKPEYTKELVHDVGRGVERVVVGGTQAIDSLWCPAKRHCRGVNAIREQAIALRIREKQWHHWIGDEDRWAAAGKVCKMAAGL